jgi:hypothetical protein
MLLSQVFPRSGTLGMQNGGKTFVLQRAGFTSGALRYFQDASSRLAVERPPSIHGHKCSTSWKHLRQLGFYLFNVNTC